MEGVEALKSSDTSRAITISDASALKNVTTDSTDGLLSAELGKLIELIDEKSSGSLLIKTPAYAECAAELHADEIVSAIGTSQKAEAAKAASDKLSIAQEADELVSNSVNLQMNSATSPEQQLAYGSAENPKHCGRR